MAPRGPSPMEPTPPTRKPANFAFFASFVANPPLTRLHHTTPLGSPQRTQSPQRPCSTLRPRGPLPALAEPTTPCPFPAPRRSRKKTPQPSAHGGASPAPKRANFAFFASFVANPPLTRLHHATPLGSPQRPRSPQRPCSTLRPRGPPSRIGRPNNPMSIPAPPPSREKTPRSMDHRSSPPTRKPACFAFFASFVANPPSPASITRHRLDRHNDRKAGPIQLGGK